MLKILHIDFIEIRIMILLSYIYIVSYTRLILKTRQSFEKTIPILCKEFIWNL